MCEKNLVIDSEKCISCGLCVRDCSAKSLELNEKKIPRFSEGGEERCFKCQHCLAICPTGALSILNKDPENSQPVKNSVNPDDLLNLIQSRRSYRDYKNENLDKERMDKLKNMLHWVPTGCNDHRLHFSFIDDVKVMHEFRNKVNKKLINILTKTPIKAVTEKFARYKDALVNGEDIIFRGAPHMLVVSSPIDAPCANVDPMIALSYFELYAQSLGVGTVWCGLGQMCLQVFPELSEQLEVPEKYKVSYVMLFGPANTNYKRTTQPNPYKIVSVKGEFLGKMNIFAKLKRFFWNIFR